MKRTILLGTLLAGLVLGAGCTSWTGHRENELQVKRIGIEANNFKIIKSKITASASCSYLFPSAGIGGTIGRLMNPAMKQVPHVGGIALGSPDLYQQAYKKLREAAQLEGKSAQLFNVTEEATLTSYIIIGDEKITLTADVIEFTGEYVDYASRGK